MWMRLLYDEGTRVALLIIDYLRWLLYVDLILVMSFIDSVVLTW